MPHPTLKNRVGCATATTGTGTLTLGSAETGYQGFSAAYGADANVDILIEDGAAWEIARDCAYSHAGGTVTRGTMEASSTGSALNLSGAAKVYVVQTAHRMNTLAPAPLEHGTLLIPRATSLSTMGTLATTAGYLYCNPFFLPQTITVDTLGVAVSTAASGATIDLALYADAGVAGVLNPGLRLASVTGLDAATTGYKSGTFSSVSLAPGQVYWLGYIALGASPTVRALNKDGIMPLLGGTVSGSAIATYACRRKTGQTECPADLTSIDVPLYESQFPPLVTLEMP